MGKKLEVERLQGCEVGQAEEDALQGSLGDFIKRAQRAPALESIFFSVSAEGAVGEGRDDVCLSGMRSLRLCSGLWHEPNIWAQMADNGGKRTDLLVCGPFREPLQGTPSEERGWLMNWRKGYVDPGLASPILKHCSELCV